VGGWGVWGGGMGGGWEKWGVQETLKKTSNFPVFRQGTQNLLGAVGREKTGLERLGSASAGPPGAVRVSHRKPPSREWAGGLLSENELAEKRLRGLYRRFNLGRAPRPGMGRREGSGGLRFLFPFVRTFRYIRFSPGLGTANDRGPKSTDLFANLGKRVAAHIPSQRATWDQKLRKKQRHGRSKGGGDWTKAGFCSFFRVRTVVIGSFRRFSALFGALLSGRESKYLEGRGAERRPVDSGKPVSGGANSSR